MRRWSGLVTIVVCIAGACGAAAQRVPHANVVLSEQQTSNAEMIRLDNGTLRIEVCEGEIARVDARQGQLAGAPGGAEFHITVVKSGRGVGEAESREPKGNQRLAYTGAAEQMRLK